MANFEAFHWNISSGINLLFLKSEQAIKQIYTLRTAREIFFYPSINLPFARGLYLFFGTFGRFLLN